MSIASEAAGASSPRGWLPFRVAIVIVVVGLLIVTCGSLIAYVLYRQTHMAWLYRLGARGGEIESDAPLAVFDALQVLSVPQALVPLQAKGAKRHICLGCRLDRSLAFLSHPSLLH